MINNDPVNKMGGYIEWKKETIVVFLCEGAKYNITTKFGKQ